MFKVGFEKEKKKKAIDPVKRRIAIGLAAGLGGYGAYKLHNTEFMKKWNPRLAAISGAGAVGGAVAEATKDKKK